jgi:SAM-dependent methyltransferase
VIDAPHPEHRKAQPEAEDFGEKYEDQNRISVALINGYFAAVESLTAGAMSGGDEELSALEIGCGEGHSTQRLVALLPDVVDFAASEYVEHQVEIARANNPGIPIASGDVYNLDRSDDSLDVVYLLEVLEHLDEPAVALREIRRVLRPGGHLVLGVPREPMWRVLNMARLKYIRHLGNTPGHLNHWSSRSIVRFVSREFGPVTDVRKPVPWTLLSARAD